MRATSSVRLWNSATLASVRPKRMKSTGTGPSITGVYMARDSMSRHQDDVNSVGSVRADDDGLLDVGGARGPGDEPRRARHHAVLVAQQAEGVLHRAHQARFRDHRDVRI